MSARCPSLCTEKQYFCHETNSVGMADVAVYRDPTQCVTSSYEVSFQTETGLEMTDWAGIQMVICSTARTYQKTVRVALNNFCPILH